MLLLWFDWRVKKPYYKRETPQVVGETDIMASAAGALNDFTALTSTEHFII